MKQYTIYNFNETNNDLQVETIFLNREDVARYLNIGVNNLARYSINYMDVDTWENATYNQNEEEYYTYTIKNKLTKNNQVVFIDTIDVEEL